MCQHCTYIMSVQRLLCCRAVFLLTKPGHTEHSTCQLGAGGSPISSGSPSRRSWASGCAYNGRCGTSQSVRRACCSCCCSRSKSTPCLKEPCVVSWPCVRGCPNCLAAPARRLENHCRTTQDVSAFNKLWLRCGRRWGAETRRQRQRRGNGVAALVVGTVIRCNMLLPYFGGCIPTVGRMDGDAYSVLIIVVLSSA